MTSVKAVAGPAVGPVALLRPEPGRWRLDPRTRLLGLVAVNALVLGNSPFAVTVAGFVLTAVLLATAGVAPRALWGFVAMFVVCVALYRLVPLATANLAVGVLALVGYWIARFSVTVGLAWYLVVSTRPSELTAALSALRCPRSLVIPLTVMLRFIPTAANELRAILDAMRLRGVATGTGALAMHPVRTAEYIIVPMLASSARMVDDLSASGLIRGLGSQPHPTSVIRLRFGAGDVLALMVMAGLAGLRLSGWGAW